MVGQIQPKLRFKVDRISKPGLGRVCAEACDGQGFLCGAPILPGGVSAPSWFPDARGALGRKVSWPICGLLL